MTIESKVYSDGTAGSTTYDLECQSVRRKDYASVHMQTYTLIHNLYTTQLVDLKGRQPTFSDTMDAVDRHCNNPTWRFMGSYTSGVINPLTWVVCSYPNFPTALHCLNPKP